MLISPDFAEHVAVPARNRIDASMQQEAFQFVKLAQALRPTIV